MSSQLKARRSNQRTGRNPLVRQISYRRENPSASTSTLLDPDNVGIASASQLNPQEVNDINYLMLDQSNYSLEVVFDRIPKSFIKHTSMLISHCNRHTSNPKLSLSGNLKKQKDVLIRFIALNNEKARLILSDGFQR